MATEDGHPTAVKELCVVCFERDSGTALQPCGHDLFCKACSHQFRTCPLCRAPVRRNDSLGLDESCASQERRGQQEVLSRGEKRVALLICLVVWLFIFIAGIVEMSSVSPSCQVGDPCAIENMTEAELSTTVTLAESWTACANCRISGGDTECLRCSEGFKNYAGQCFKYYENIPAHIVGSTIGGNTYFVLIIVTQVCGCFCECLLIARTHRRRLLPKKELIVLVSALFIEISRICMIDVFMLVRYFSKRSYSIFREPLFCSEDSDCWFGADGLLYQTDWSTHSPGTRYYVASRQGAFTADSHTCTLFAEDSAILDFDNDSSHRFFGHSRYVHLGWVLGGEFALCYFFATFVNEFADIMFVIPTTTRQGWLFKVLSVALEIFQLGAVCPAAIFTHGDCLHYTDPLGVPLHLVRLVVVTFGYCVWGFLVLALPLALGGQIFVNVCYVIYLCLSRLSAKLLHCCRGRRCARHGNQLLKKLDKVLSDQVDNLLGTLRRRSGQALKKRVETIICLAFLPMLLSGLWLGSLVIVGQASKQGAAQVLTAIVLLSDVLFKVFATAIIETLDYALHVRVSWAVAARTAAQGSAEATHPAATTLGQPVPLDEK